MYVNGYDHPHILAGQGTMGLEIMEQVPDVEAVVIPAGNAGPPSYLALFVRSFVRSFFLSFFLAFLLSFFLSFPLSLLTNGCRSS